MLYICIFFQIYLKSPKKSLFANISIEQQSIFKLFFDNNDDIMKWFCLNYKTLEVVIVTYLIENRWNLMMIFQLNKKVQVKQAWSFTVSVNGDRIYDLRFDRFFSVYVRSGNLSKQQWSDEIVQNLYIFIVLWYLFDINI